MKKLLSVFSLAIVLFACEKKAAETPPAEEKIALPVEFSYKGTPTIGSYKNVVTVIECNKKLEALNADVGEFLADTVSWHSPEGVDTTVTRDIMVAMLKDFVGSLNKMEISFTHVMPVDNKDAGHEWVFSWTDETYTFKDGKVDKQELHENYRMENGKIAEIFQYSKKP